MHLMLKGLTALALTVALAAGAPAWSRDADADTARVVKDRQEIEALLWRYITALDGYDPELYASTFVEDGVVSQPSGTSRGRAEMRKMIADLKVLRRTGLKPEEPIPPRRHIVTNETIEFTGPDRATHKAYWLTVAKAAGKYDIVNMGVYDDELARKDGKWLFVSRKILAD